MTGERRIAAPWFTPSSPVEVAVLAVVAALLLKTVADPDLWGHLTFGRFILAEGIPQVDPFSYTAGGAPWINHEWLSEVVMYAVFRAAGPIGLVALKAALLACVVGVVMLAVRDAGGELRASGLLAVVLVIGGLASFVTIRPHMFTFPLFAVLLLAIARADRGRPGLLCCTPALTALWSNLHGGVAAGLAVLLVWGGIRLAQAASLRIDLPLPEPLRRGAPNSRTTTVIALVIIFQLPAALMTPYGTHLWQFVGQTIASGLPELSEWQHPMLDELQDVLALAALATLIALVVIPRRLPRDPLHFLLVGLLIAAGVSARRHLTLALIGAAVLGAPAAAQVIRRRSGIHAHARSFAMGAAVLLLAGAVLLTGLWRARCVQILPGSIPRATVAYLESAEVSGNLVVFFDWGLYAIWRLSPRLRVSIDTRATSVYPASVLRGHIAFLDARPGWRDALTGSDVALLSPRFLVYDRLAAEPEWRLAFSDEVSGLFVRRGSGADAALARAPIPVIEPETRGCLGRSG